MKMWEHLEAVERRYREIEELMAQPEVAADLERLQALARERASLEELVHLYQQYKKTVKEIQETRALLEDSIGQELEELAREELSRLLAQEQKLQKDLRLALLPKDPNDQKDIIVEIRAGAGGEEASLFAADLFRMYTRYAQSKNWTVEVLDRNETGLGGFKEIIFEVRGQGAYSRLKHERGVHRVQRIPITESGGRIHTSTATVAVLPKADELEIHINPEDLRIDVFHASGPGGQNVNKVATAIRVVHLPTGITAVCQDERSQYRNKQKALALLRARLLDREMRRQQAEITEARRSQVGSAERAEKIRTYNFPQNRVTDHRIGLTLYSLDRVLDGDLDELIEALVAQEQAKLLEESVT